MASIARIIDKPPATVFSYLQRHGGIRPRHRVRRAEALSMEEREDISLGIFSWIKHSIYRQRYVPRPFYYKP